MDSPGLRKASHDFNNFSEFSGVLKSLGFYNEVVDICVGNIFVLKSNRIWIRFGVKRLL